MTNLLAKILFFIPKYIILSSVFELRSFLGRLFSKSLKIDKQKENNINLGCGPIVIPGMINIDFFLTKNIDYGADLRFPLKIQSESIDGIICEHTLEHLTYESDEQLLKECHRIMKKGAIIRIILPDLSKFLINYAKNNQAWFDEWESINFTNSPNPDRKKRSILTPLQAISYVTQEYGHISCWDEPTLKAFLSNAGFVNIKTCKFGEGSNKALLIDSDQVTRKYVSIYMEAQKG